MEIIVEGYVAPWMWTGNSFVQSPLYDPGIFTPAGTSLTGDAVHIVWHSDPIVTADFTINGVTVTFGPATGFYAPYAQVTATYQNITVNTFSPYKDLIGNIALNSYDPEYAAAHNPHGIGGSFELICCPVNQAPGQSVLDGYFYVTAMYGDDAPPITTILSESIASAPPVSVPGPIAGDGIAGLLIFASLCVVLLRKGWANALPPDADYDHG